MSVILDLSYKQFSIFNETIENPFNDWDDISFEQGFTYRFGSIGIKTIISDGDIIISVDTNDNIREDSIRILELPFDVYDNNIEISTINSSFKIEILPGKYKVRIQFLKQIDDKDNCIISFLKFSNLDELPKYIKYDEEITRTNNYNLNAIPAK